MARQTYDFQQDECNLTITTPVPAQVSAKDVEITIQADRLVVSVLGHARQPSVLNGVLFYDVDPESLEWELSGSGDARVLVLTLAKAEPIDWDDGLFRCDTVCKAPPSDLARDWMPMAAPSVEPSAEPSAEPPRARASAQAPSLRASSSLSERTRSKVTDYKRFDQLELSDDDDASRRDRPLVFASDAGRIWSELMSGEKKLLTKNGVVTAAAPAAVANGFGQKMVYFGDLD